MSVQEALQGTDLMVCTQPIKEALKYVAGTEGETAFLSAGNTREIAKRAYGLIGPIYPGVAPILAVNMPTADSHFILADIGGSIKFDIQHATWIALAGRVVAQVLLDIESPVLALLNIAREEGRGDPEREEIRKGLAEVFGDQFIGNAEINEASRLGVKVLVTDGVTGNNVLKATEAAWDVQWAMVKYLVSQNSDLESKAKLLRELSQIFWSGLNWRNFAAFALHGLKELVLVAHGRSDLLAFYTALLKANDPLSRVVHNRIKEDPDIKAHFAA